MADNLAVTPGSGATVAADDIGGVLFQRIKLGLGADGTAVDAVAGAGAVGTGVQRVTLASDDPAVAALQVLDNAISGSEMQVDVVAPLPAGTNNIGDVDVVTLPALPTGTNVVGQVGIDQTTPGTTDSVSVKSVGYVSAPTVTRPANTTAYTAGDVVGGAITFTSAGPSGGHLMITDVDLRIDVSAVPSGMTTFRLHLYDVTPPSAIADNSPWDLPSGDRASYLGFVDLGTIVDVGSTLYVQATGINRKVKLASGSTSLFGYLVTNGGFTPAGNSEVYTPRIGGYAL